MTTEKKTSPSVMSDSSLHSDSVRTLFFFWINLKCSLLLTIKFFFFLRQVSKLQLSSKETLSSDWSLLPEELLHIISSKLENCFDFIHARSVCRPWRSIFPFPSSSLLRTRYSLPSFDKFPRKARGFCTLEKFPVFLFRVRDAPDDASLPSEFFVGRIRLCSEPKVHYTNFNKSKLCLLSCSLKFSSV